MTAKPESRKQKAESGAAPTPVRSSHSDIAAVSDFGLRISDLFRISDFGIRISARRRAAATILVMVLALSFQAAPVLACAACAGQSDDPQAQGMNWGIFAMLGVVGLVLGAVASFFIYLAKRAAAAPDPLDEPLLPEPTDPIS